MADDQKYIKTLAIATLGLGCAYILTKYRTNLKSVLRRLTNRNSLRFKSIKVINTEAECKFVVELLMRQCCELGVLGFDCEWVTVGGARRPIALLQLASHDGFCALFRLCRLKKIPPELRALLEDNNILKVGVAPIDDARYLANDFSIQMDGTSDLRHLAIAANKKPQGLANMSSDILGVTLDKNWRIRCSDWEAENLTKAQQEYAAGDALVAIELFKKLSSNLPNSSLLFAKSNYSRAADICRNFINIKYKQRSSQAKVQSGFGEPHKSQRNGTISKPYYRNFSTRKKPLYHNCYLEAPDGELLCTCDRKKAEWYVHKLLGEIISEDPFTVRLKFEPSGRAVGEVGQYYTQAKINQCVVCGEQHSYIRKNVVPREYRKLFPVVMKEHTSHDVLLLCTSCHQKSNISDLSMRRKLGIMCGAPLESEEGSHRLIQSADMRQLKSAARALLYSSDIIPDSRKEILRQIILRSYPDSEITEQLLKQACEVQTTLPNMSYEPHGSKVVEYFSTNPDTGGLVGLERMWREHFLQVMKPEFLPPLWSVTHNANRLKIRAEEGRVEASDLVLAGIDHQRNADLIE
ncbi:exonuclease 3'-5' domain-containing protein 2-like [Ctenocephalides felis]|uniref:exonuclease 3'-5' domain-containing protein 2-like n=1 Tax=Ctenocephalides felis TaxID=7515 RepID=UPI000E6E4726|nr:exonuclease 3'-5' domain-containing protein 2-like [Ctenocephalides felis]